MGDGIHYDLPLFGEGVNQGIHDGARLVNLLTNWEYKNLFDAVLQWEADTKKRHKLIKQKSKWLNKLELVESPFWSDVRDSALKWGGWSGLYNKLYFDLWKAEDDAFKDYQFLKPPRDPTIYYEFATPDKRQWQ
jgi:2-polyprenyl-6-methoxyphenol hydroxylase-like FAD-dependent oxidoreductase